MAISLTAQRLRFAIDASNPFVSTPTNLLNNQSLVLPSGSSLQFELLFYFQSLVDANLLDLTQFSEIVVALQDNTDPHSGTVYYSGSVAAANFNLVATVEGFQTVPATAASAHVVLNIPSAQNAVPAGNTSYWLVIYGVSTDANTDNVLLFASNINGKDSGIPSGVASLSAGFKAGSKLSFVCGDGLTRDLQLAAGPNGIWVTAINQAGYNGPGQAIFSLYCVDGQYRDLSLQLQNGNYVLAVNPNGHS